jgi:glycosyltransferase involved in cell wall biosynthesis
MTHRTQKEYLVSVFLPSRKRPQDLDKTLKSLINLSDKSLDNFEIVIKVDFDDKETLDYISQWGNEHENITFIINSRLKGWYNLVDFNEDLIRVARGKYVFGFNDDCLMLTQDWNKILEQYLTDFSIYYTKIEWDVDLNGYYHNFRYAFPIFPKKLVEIWGFLCPHNNIDNWFLDIANKCASPPWNEKTKIHIDEITLYHSQFPDETSQDKLKTISENHSLRDSYRDSDVFFHCVNLLKEHRDYLKWDIIHKHNIVNNYINTNEKPPFS